jgi:hypothetical protein
MVAALAVVIGACDAFGFDMDHTFSVTVPANRHIDELTIDLVDRTGTVTAMEIVHGRFLEGVAVDPADRAVIVVTWMGGMCDLRTKLTVAPTIDTIRISEVTDVGPGACRMAGIMRSIAIRIDPPLSPEFVEFG